MPPHIAASVGSLDDKSYTSEQHVPTTHEHYVKVYCFVLRPDTPAYLYVLRAHKPGY
jgi:hypothetical protein